jgi:exonuclease III
MNSRNRETPMNREPQTIKILQCNLQRGKEKTHSILNHPDSKQFTVLLVQEQNWSAFLDSSQMHNMSWTLIEPSKKSERPPRTAIYINKRLLQPTDYEQKDFPFADITAITIKTSHQKPTLLINVYNPPTKDDSIIAQLRDHMRNNVRDDDYHNIIMAGDFNLHHPLWNPPTYAKHEDDSDELIRLMADHSMRLLIPPGTITFPDRRNKKTTNPTTPTAMRQERGTAIDLVWGNEAAERAMIKCKVARKKDHGSDHYPIETELDLAAHTHSNRDKMPFNYTKTDWTTLRTKIAEYLPNIIDAMDPNLAPTDLDSYATNITEAIRRAIQETTPRKKISPFSKSWWNDKLTELRRKANKLRNAHRRNGNTVSRRKWRKAQNKYHDEIKAAKECTWREFVASAEERTIWKIKKYIDTIPTQTHISTLDNETTNEGKSAKFRDAFFPPPPPADISDINDKTTYPGPVPCNERITMQQLERAVDRLAPDKAPGPDEITNRVLKKNFDILQHHLLAMVQASLNIGHFPTPFKITTTVVLRKPSKLDYTKPNAYRVPTHRTKKHNRESAGKHRCRDTQLPYRNLRTTATTTFWRKTRTDCRRCHDVAVGENTPSVETPGDIHSNLHGCCGSIQ